MPDSISYLLESADRCLDDTANEMKDWDHLLGYIHSSTFNIYIRLQTVPCIGKFFQELFYQELAQTYDIILNFKEAHEAADLKIQDMIKKKHMENILEESRKQVLGCDSLVYKFTMTFSGFSEICKVI